MLSWTHVLDDHSGRRRVVLVSGSRLEGPVGFCLEDGVDEFLFLLSLCRRDVLWCLVVWGGFCVFVICKIIYNGINKTNYSTYLLQARSCRIRQTDRQTDKVPRA